MEQDGALTKSEFLAHIGYVREDVAGINTRLDALNGQTRKHGEAIAVLQSQHQPLDQYVTKRDFAIGIGVLASVGAVVEFFTRIGPWLGIKP